MLRLTLLAVVLAPLMVNTDPDAFVLSTEVYKALLSVCEILVLYYFFSRKTDPSNASTIIFHTALGWAITDLVFGYFLTYIYGASGDEREWKYIYTAIAANFSIVSALTPAGSVRHYGNRVCMGQGREICSHHYDSCCFEELNPSCYHVWHSRSNP